jgi:hypothetical protein
MTEHTDNTLLAVIASTWKLLAAWLGSITLLQFQAGLGICSTLVVMGYTLWKWRREAKQKQ